ncbi:hypothetical protein B7494_g8606 [Chlorociboria aeruginascens]|nr:hypothetical protein B7494_g8606 [Chlorociboria aeruginascens]
MADATLPPPRSSSVTPVTTETESDARPTTSTSELVSEPSQLPSIIPGSKEEARGESEQRTENKQKRKRTSPKDQSTLEAEYKQNPKPNKAARAEIVKKVDLNEKEVQIWFQNRRQINRRKSRPLLPHEFAAFGLGGIPALSSDPASFIFSSSQSGDDPTLSLSDPIGDSQNNFERLEFNPSSQPSTQESGIKATSTELPVDQYRPSLPPLVPELKTRSFSDSFTESSSFIANENVSKSFSSMPGYLANRWNQVSSLSSTPSSQSTIFPPFSSQHLSSSCPERILITDTRSPSSSQVRLSMSLDGKAELVSNELSPHRPHSTRPFSSGSIQRHRMPGLQRSQSAVTFSPLPRNSPPSNSVPRMPSGRSRDARAWEFCCDTDTRDELIMQAENESHGSAVAAISLIRSTSSSALKPNTNKRNAPAAKQESIQHGKKLKLGRATSSLARLQNSGKSAQLGKPGKEDALTKSPSGDSDKENWIPDGNGGNPRRRMTAPAPPNKKPHSRTVLGDNFNVPSHAVDFGGSKKRRWKQLVEAKVFEDQEEAEGEVDEEVQRFMGGNGNWR